MKSLNAALAHCDEHKKKRNKDVYQLASLEFTALALKQNSCSMPARKKNRLPNAMSTSTRSLVKLKSFDKRKPGVKSSLAASTAIQCAKMFWNCQ